MKKNIYVFISVTFVLITLFSVNAFAKEYINGDVDNDGKISSADARLALRASVGLEDFKKAQFNAADYDNNGKITAADARLILRTAVGLDPYVDNEKDTSTISKCVTGLTFEQGTKLVKYTDPKLVGFCYPYYMECVQNGYTYIPEEINGVKLSWDKFSGATGYKIYVEKNGKWEYLATTKETEHTVDNLTPGKVYKFAVRYYKEVNGKKQMCETYTSISAASKPNKTTLTVKIKNNKAYITWDKKTCSGYSVYIKYNNGEYKRIDIKDQNTTSYIYEYPAYAYSVSVSIKPYAKTYTGKVYSESTSKTIKMAPAETDGGIKLHEITSKTAKEIYNKYGSNFANYYEGITPDGTVLIYAVGFDKYSGIDIKGRFYDTYGNIKMCPNCGKTSGKGTNMCNGCAVVFN